MYAGPARCRSGIKLADLFILMALLAVATSTTAQPRPPFDAPPGPADRAHVNAAIDRLPIRFEPLDEKGTFIARTIGASIRLSGRTIDFPIATDSTGTNSIRVQFVGARKSSRVIGIEPLPGRVNYLYGDDPSRWRRNVPTYARARTSNLYRGIDVLYYGADDQLEYDLIVRPGARPDSIRLAITGTSVAVSDDGDLVDGSNNRVLLHKPIAYQTIDGVRRDVKVAYQRRDDGSVGFSVGTYDRSQLLVIDPIIAYSFSFGGSGDEQVYDIAADDTGAVYVGGETYSNNFPTVNPAQGRDDAGDACTFYGNSICRDAFLAKVAPDGKSVVYATYFGSADFDQVNHIVVDASHALYFTGWTTTQTNSAQPDVRNSFIGKLAPDGSHFVYTYYTPRCCLSGPQLVINDLAVGTDGSAYVVTSTPTSSEVAVLPPTGTNYHSIYTLPDPSGVRRTSFNSIAVQGSSLFIGGNTTWSAFPTTPGAAQTVFGGIRDGVVMRRTLSGSPVYSTFIGSGDSETLADIAVDQDGAAYVVGDTSATDSSCGPSQPLHRILVAKLRPDGGSVVYSTSLSYQFGTCFFPAVRIGLDGRGNAYTVGCGFESAVGIGCTLWKVSPSGIGLMFPDMPWYRFAIDASGTAKWFAPVTGQVTITKLVSRLEVSLISLVPSPSRFATPLTWVANVITDNDEIEFSFWRYDADGGWREVQPFGPRSSHQWTPGLWDVGDHTVCAVVRFLGLPDQPRSACAVVSITGLTIVEPPALAPAADFNADRRPDLIWVNTATGQMAMWNVGGGAHGEQVLGGGYLTGASLPADWRVAGSGDIDGDGHTDLFLQSSAGLLGAWLYDGPTLRFGITLTPGQVGDPNWQIRAAGDLNHDGHPDLIWQYAPTGQVAFWLMNGTTAIGFVIPNVMAPGGDWEIVGTGDSNRDGQRDIFWQQRSTGTLAVWWMNGASIAGASVMSASPDPKWRAVAVADVDGDAYSDLVFQHADTNVVAVWSLQGNTVRFGVTLSPSTVGEPGWKIAGPR